MVSPTYPNLQKYVRTARLDYGVLIYTLRAGSRPTHVMVLGEVAPYTRMDNIYPLGYNSPKSVHGSSLANEGAGDIRSMKKNVT